MRHRFVISELRESLNEEINEQGYDVIKKNNSHWIITKDGKEYHVQKKENATNWQCTCPGFKYRGTCKHLAMCDLTEPTRYPREKIDEFYPNLNNIFGGTTWEIVGSYRRGKPTFKDIDILVTCSPAIWSEVTNKLLQDPDFEKVVSGAEIIRGTYKGYLLDVNRVEEDDYASQLLYRTGSKNFNIKMRARAKSLAWGLNEHGLVDSETKELTKFYSEEEAFKLLYVEYLPPEKRENPVLRYTKIIPRIVEYGEKPTPEQYEKMRSYR